MNSKEQTHEASPADISGHCQLNPVCHSCSPEGQAPVFSARALAVAGELVRELAARKETLSGAESCTAGLVSSLIGSVPGASNVLWGSYICYTEGAKMDMLGIPGDLIKEHGLVSQSVALAMARGALLKSGVSWAYSVTGLAGPGGDGSGTPVGTVWIAVVRRGEGQADCVLAGARKHLFTGGRDEVRYAAAAAALESLLQMVCGQ